MKKLLAVTVILGILLVLCSCGGIDIENTTIYLSESDVSDEVTSLSSMPVPELSSVPPQSSSIRSAPSSSDVSPKINIPSSVPTPSSEPESSKVNPLPGSPVKHTLHKPSAFGIKIKSFDKFTTVVTSREQLSALLLKHFFIDYHYYGYDITEDEINKKYDETFFALNSLIFVNLATDFYMHEFYGITTNGNHLCVGVTKVNTSEYFGNDLIVLQINKKDTSSIQIYYY